MERNGQNGMEKITRFSIAKRNGTGMETGLFFDSYCMHVCLQSPRRFRLGYNDKSACMLKDDMHMYMYM